MISKKVTVVDETGLHLRPAGILCRIACQYKSKIEFKCSKGMANAKSILSVLGSCVQQGDEIEFFCDGEDEKEALDELVASVAKGLGEDFKVKE